MKKIKSLLLVAMACTVVAMFAGCSNTMNNQEEFPLKRTSWHVESE